MNDDRDETIAQAFEELRQVAAPDVWSRVPGDSVNAVVQHTPERPTPKYLVAAGAALFAIGLAVFAFVNRTDEATIDTAAATDPPVVSAISAPCDAFAVASSLAEGMPLIDFATTASPNDLAEQSVGVVRGQLLTADSAPGGAYVRFKQRDLFPESLATQGPVTNLWIPATGAPTDFLSMDFVAFLAREDVPVLTDGQPSWPTLIEGFWISCDDSSPAVSVLSTPIESGWREAIAAGITLDELWDIAQLPEKSTSEPLGPPVTTTEDADIFDLALIGGERFRLSLPSGLGSDLMVMQTPKGDGVRLEGSVLELTIGYGFCSTPDGLIINPLGMEVASASSTSAVACRSDELLSMSIESQTDIAESDLALIDLRPIFAAGTYGEKLREFWTELESCSNCSPWGPMIFGEQNVVVNRTGQTSFSAVALDSLADVWTVDTGGFGSQMHAGKDSIYLSDPAGPFVKIEAQSGQQLWSIDIAEEHAVKLSSSAPGRILLQTSFLSEGDNRAPRLRSIDDQTGEIIWATSGRDSSEWQFTTPVVFDGLAIVMDVYDNPAVPAGGPGSVLHAFDVETGEVVWTADLESRPALFSSGLLFVADYDDGQALIAMTVDGDVLRFNPANGTIMWRARINAFAIDGTDFDEAGALAISAMTRAGQVLLSPLSGEVVS